MAKRKHYETTIKAAAAAAGVSRPTLRSYIRKTLVTPVEGKGIDIAEVLAAKALSKQGNVMNEAIKQGDLDAPPDIADNTAAAAGKLDAQQVVALRQRAVADLDIMKVLEKEGVLVNAVLAKDIYALFLKEIRERVKSLPSQWQDTLTQRGKVPPDVAKRLLQDIAAALLRDFKEGVLDKEFGERLDALRDGGKK